MVIEEEITAGKKRKLKIISDNGSVLLKLDVYCKVDVQKISNYVKELYDVEFEGSHIKVFISKSVDSIQGIIVCVDKECHMVDIISIGGENITFPEWCGEAGWDRLEV